jgi:hypothetical protein
MSVCPSGLRSAVYGGRQREPGGRIDRMELDEVWAYRARSADDVTPVRVLRFGTKKPSRALVRFEDPVNEGHEERVPPVRLKVRWADAETFRARKARWAADHQHDRIHGEHMRGPGRRGDHYLKPEVIQDVDDEHCAPRRALLRQWRGDEAGAR